MQKLIETKAEKQLSDNELVIDNYQILRLDRNRHGGGIVMYIHSSLSSHVLSAGANELELLVVSVKQDLHAYLNSLTANYSLTLFSIPDSVGSCHRRC